MNKYSSKSVWGASPAGTTFSNGALPGTREFFEKVKAKRDSYEMPWLFDLRPFKVASNEKVLELGCGAGYDAFEFCRNGADYTGIDITPQNIERTRKHLSFYGFTPRLTEGDAEKLPFQNETFDMVFSNGVLHHTPDMKKSFREAYRVLKLSGRFWVILYHKHSIFYWVSLMLVEHILKLGFVKKSFRERLSMIEYTTSTELPLVNVYSRKELRNLLNRTGFSVESVWIRKLTREDLPALPLVSRLWRYIPQPWLDFFGKRFGWYVIAKAVKV